MKNVLKYIVAFVLGLFARMVIRKYRPLIVMVTGSVGKTSTKDAVAEVLSTRFFVRKSEKSFNSEFGVPFTILGAENPWSNPFAWLSIIKNAFALILLPNHYPNMLVLETGADKQGDLSRILRIATPDMVVVTRLPEIPVHVEAYASPEAVRDEEFSPAYALKASAPLIIPSDNEYVLDCAKRTPARCITYGVTEDASVRVSDADFYVVDGKVLGMQAKITLADLPSSKRTIVMGGQVNMIVKGSVGKTQLLPCAAALAAALAYEIKLSDALKALESYEPPAGRGRILDGVNNSTIIDDSYNSSPAAVEEALATLKTFPVQHGGRRIAVLGDMLELGRYSVTEHERIAALASESADVVVSVGIRARAFTATQKNIGFLHFENSSVAAKELPALIQEGDIILVKGSQSVRMERVVEALLANYSDASKLVRQEKKWRERA